MTPISTIHVQEEWNVTRIWPTVSHVVVYIPCSKKKVIHFLNIVGVSGRFCAILWGFKNGPFAQKAKKNMIFCDSKRSSFFTDFVELQLDTATLIIHSFRKVKARGCRGSNLIYHVITWYLVGCACNTIIMRPFFAFRPKSLFIPGCV